MSDEMERKEAIRLFEENNELEIADYHSDRRACRVNKKIHDQYIGNDIFESNVQFWLDNFEEQETLLRLLANYTYVPELMYGGYLDDLTDDVAARCKEGKAILADTCFITFPSSKGIKSGGDVIRSLLPVGHLESIGKDQLIADAGKNLNYIKNAKCIVFIDDMVGSGETARKNVTRVLDKLGSLENKKIFLAVMFAETSSIERLKAEFQSQGYPVEVFAHRYCQKCMSEGYIFSREEIGEKEGMLREYEERIAGQKVNQGNSCAMGFRNSQLLLSFFYNTPNNTLCMFWSAAGGNAPPFARTSRQRPKIDEIKGIRERRKRNAYEMAKLARTNE